MSFVAVSITVKFSISWLYGTSVKRAYTSEREGCNFSQLNICSNFLSIIFTDKFAFYTCICSRPSLEVLKCLLIEMSFQNLTKIHVVNKANHLFQYFCKNIWGIHHGKLLRVKRGSRALEIIQWFLIFCDRRTTKIINEFTDS